MMQLCGNAYTSAGYEMGMQRVYAWACVWHMLSTANFFALFLHCRYNLCGVVDVDSSTQRLQVATLASCYS
jgi:hypothetical protein